MRKYRQSQYDKVMNEFQFLPEYDLRRQIVINRSEMSYIATAGPILALCGAFVSIGLTSITEVVGLIVTAIYATFLLLGAAILAGLNEKYTRRAEVAKQILEQRREAGKRSDRGLLRRFF